MSKRSVIQSIGFGSDVAEHEAKELARYFVETDQWARISAGQVDLIYGAKGSGKSAIYHLMMNKKQEFKDRKILLISAENPDEDPAFTEISADLPTAEAEFKGLWKLYLCSVAAIRARDAGVKNAQLDEVLTYLAELGLVEGHVSLNTIVRRISDYVARFFKPSSVTATTNFDPTTGTFIGVTGKISFSEPPQADHDRGVRPIREILLKLDAALESAGLTIWLLLDRLDVAFTESEHTETLALRSLFGAYKDMSGLEHIRPKLFIRTDIWERIVDAGFREATHATSSARATTLSWNTSLLFNLFMKRLLQSDILCQEFSVNRDELLQDVLLQEQFIDRIFPEKIDTGKKPKTFAWVCGRLQDGTKQTMPRELIQFCLALRTEQLQRIENAAAPLLGELLFERASFRLALPPVSKTRLTQTIFAENPGLKSWVLALSGKKSLQSLDTLATIWRVAAEECRNRADKLVAIGVLEPKQPRYEIPLLYRPALEIIRGAEAGLRDEVQKDIETDANDTNGEDEPEDETVGSV